MMEIRNKSGDGENKEVVMRQECKKYAWKCVVTKCVTKNVRKKCEKKSN